MAKKAQGPTFEALQREIRSGVLRPVYYLMGEESYYIDQIEQCVLDAALRPEERDFNLIMYYGEESNIEDIVTAARSFPMGAQRMVIIVREAQRLKRIELLESYLRQPQPSTVLIFCHKDGRLDRRSKVASLIDKVGVLFEAEPVKSGLLPTFVQNYFRSQQIDIEPQAAILLAEHVGNDLTRLVSEMDKVCIALQSANPKNVTIDIVVRNVGINKEYNFFELQDALTRKDITRVMKIVDFFGKNVKQFPLQTLLPQLFTYFRNIFLAYYAPDRSEGGVASWLGVNPWAAKLTYVPAMRMYSARKSMAILTAIRRADARSKGVGMSSSVAEADLLKELFFFILH